MINKTKNKVTVCDRDELNRTTSVVNNDILEEVKEFTYLRNTIVKAGRNKKKIRARTARAAFKKKRIFSSISKSWVTRKRFLKAQWVCLQCCLTYGRET